MGKKDLKAILAQMRELANRELAAAVARLAGFSEALLTPVADRPGHDRRYAMTDAKLRALGWQPCTRFEDALTNTVAWYAAHPPSVPGRARLSGPTHHGQQR